MAVADVVTVVVAVVEGPPFVTMPCEDLGGADAKVRGSPFAASFLGGDTGSWDWDRGRDGRRLSPGMLCRVLGGDVWTGALLEVVPLLAMIVAKLTSWGTRAAGSETTGGSLVVAGSLPPTIRGRDSSEPCVPASISGHSWSARGSVLVLVLVPGRPAQGLGVGLAC